MCDQDRFIGEALAAHNKVRALHGSPALTHNRELSSIALQYAKYLASIRSLVHSKNKFKNQSIGENLSMWMSTGADHYDGERATMQWYNEIKDYDFSNGNFTSGTGHFTQVVWKNSQEVGFGFARSADGAFYAVANYYPAGNMMGQFKQNVLPPNSKPQQTRPDTTPSPSSSISLVDDRQQLKFIEDALTRHNVLRSRHNAPPLRHNPELSRIASAWAKKLADQGRLSLSHNQYRGAHLGENVAVSSNQDYDG
jgi:uncharacterized protein YkwD